MSNRTRAVLGLLGLGLSAAALAEYKRRTAASAKYKRSTAGYKRLPRSYEAVVTRQASPHVAQVAQDAQDASSEQADVPVQVSQKVTKQSELPLCEQYVHAGEPIIRGFLGKPYAIVLSYFFGVDLTHWDNKQRLALDTGTQELKMQATGSGEEMFKPLILQLRPIALIAQHNVSTKSGEVFQGSIILCTGDIIVFEVETPTKSTAWANFILEIEPKTTTFFVHLWRFVHKKKHQVSVRLSYNENGDLQRKKVVSDNSSILEKITDSDLYDVLYAVLCKNRKFTWDIFPP